MRETEAWEMRSTVLKHSPRIVTPSAAGDDNVQEGSSEGPSQVDSKLQFACTNCSLAKVTDHASTQH